MTAVAFPLSAEQSEQYWRRRNNRGFVFNASLDWTTPIKGLKAHLEGGYTYGFNEVKNWYGSTTTQASYVGGNPLADWQKTNTSSIRESFTLTYDTKINKIHHFNVMAGQEYRTGRSNYNKMDANNFSKAFTAEEVFANFGLGTMQAMERRRNNAHHLWRKLHAILRRRGCRPVGHPVGRGHHLLIGKQRG